MISLVPYPLSSDSSDSEEKETIQKEEKTEEQHTRSVGRNKGGDEFVE